MQDDSFDCPFLCFLAIHPLQSSKIPTCLPNNDAVYGMFSVNLEIFAEEKLFLPNCLFYIFTSLSKANNSYTYSN